MPKGPGDRELLEGLREVCSETNTPRDIHDFHEKWQQLNIPFNTIAYGMVVLLARMQAFND